MKTLGDVPCASISISPCSNGVTTVRISSGHADHKTEVDATCSQGHDFDGRKRNGEENAGCTGNSQFTSASLLEILKNPQGVAKSNRESPTQILIPVIEGRIAKKDKSRAFSDFHLRSLVLQDNGNVMALSVTALSTTLADVGYGQKDFLVAAKAVINGDDISVEPTKAQEDTIDLARIRPGQGIVMLQYLAFTNKIAHVFSKGQVSVEQHKKAVAACVAVCQNNAVAAVEALRRKYDSLLDEKRSHSTPAVPVPITALPNLTDTQKSGMKASFGQMLAGINTNMATNVESGVASRPTPVPLSQSTAPPPSQPAAKKLTLAELAKRKKQ